MAAAASLNINRKGVEAPYRKENETPLSLISKRILSTHSFKSLHLVGQNLQHLVGYVAIVLNRNEFAAHTTADRVYIFINEMGEILMHTFAAPQKEVIEAYHQAYSQVALKIKINDDFSYEVQR